MIATLIHLLCAITSGICAALLLRGYQRSGVRLLFWCGLCFVGLMLNNVLLFIDLQVLPDTDLSTWRTLPALAGVLVLIYGMVWESR